MTKRTNQRISPAPVDHLLPQFGEPITPWWRSFAWRPTWTIDRGTVWLRLIHRRRIAKHNYLTGGPDFWWQNAVKPTPQSPPALAEDTNDTRHAENVNTTKNELQA